MCNTLYMRTSTSIRRFQHEFKSATHLQEGKPFEWNRSACLAVMRTEHNIRYPKAREYSWTHVTMRFWAPKFTPVSVVFARIFMIWIHPSFFPRACPENLGYQIITNHIISWYKMVLIKNGDAIFQSVCLHYRNVPSHYQLVFLSADWIALKEEPNFAWKTQKRLHSEKNDYRFARKKGAWLQSPR